MINVSLYLEGKCPQSTLIPRAFSSTIFKTVEKTLGTRLLSVETYREEGACLSLMLKIPEISVRIQMERSVSGFLLEYLESSHWRWSAYSRRNILTEQLLRRSIFDKPVFTLIREFGKGIKNGKSHSHWFNQKMSLHSPSQVFPLISDRSVWHPRSPFKMLFCHS